MAKKSSTNDILQIMMMTFYLMAVFFGGWGAYNHFFRVEEELARRDREQKGLIEVQKLLKDEENREALIQWRKREESKRAGDERLGREVSEVLAALRPAPAIANQNSSPPKKQGKDGKDAVTLYEFNISFKPTSIQGGPLQFVQMVETLKPHLSFEKVEITKRSKKNTSEDNWASEFTIVNYVAD
ncbi:MAG: hypothetical protein KDC38_04010 [Planctomycetes bacterium]|nr:hypothetical protein [Planctomycetota bacterium]